jgi:hypothetical protein
MVEYMLHNLKVQGSRPACMCSNTFCYTPGKFRWRRKLTRKFRPTCQNFFCYMNELSQRHPVWVAEINVTACNSVECLTIGWLEVLAVAGQLLATNPVKKYSKDDDARFICTLNVSIQYCIQIKCQCYEET